MGEGVYVFFRKLGKKLTLDFMNFMKSPSETMSYLYSVNSQSGSEDDVHAKH